MDTAPGPGSRSESPELLDGLLALDSGRLLVVPEKQAVAEALGLRSFRDGLNLPGRILRDLADRKNVIVEAPRRDGQGQENPSRDSPRFFLKILRSRRRARRLGSDRGKGLAPAVRELGNLLLFRHEGLDVPVPVAAGAEPREGVSFVLTEEVRGARTLEEWLATLEPRRDRREFLALLAEVARLTRIMHGAGLFHRDYYLCHLLRREDPRAPLVILDVERVIRNPVRRTRWMVKDLAALSSSASPGKVSSSDRLRFLLRYLAPEGHEVPRATLRRLIRKILRKEDRIRRHVPEKERRRR